MAFHHRKLLQDSIDLNATQICDFFCAPNNVDDGYCPSSCFSVCSLTCYRPFTLVQFPPTSLPDSIPNLHHQNKSPNLHLYLSISFALLATALFLFACFSSYRYFRIRRSSTPPENGEGGGDRELRDDDPDEFLDEEHGPVVDHPIWYIRTVGLQPSIINAITVCKYKKSDGLVEGTECSVCLSEFEEDETLRLLPKCSHAFHIPCIDTWLRSHTNCPNCRAAIFSPPSPVPVAAQETATIGIETPQPTIHEESEPESESESAPLDRENEIRDTRGDEDFQPIRRSVSASIMSEAIDDAYPDQDDANSNTQLENSVPKKVKGSQSLIRLIGGGGDRDCDGSPSVLPSGIRPCLGKRSFSCSVLVKVLSK